MKLSETNCTTQAIIKGYRERGDWPQDDWFTVGQILDLNLYVKNGKRAAALYDVDPRTLQTITDTWTPIELED